MEWLVNNWYLIVAFLCIGIAIVTWIVKFMKLPTKKQIESIKEWLKWAVLEAEKELGSGTGKAKLRMVYDMAISKFGWLSFISFETFSNWVDEALEEVNKWLKENKNLSDFVEK